MMVLAAISGCGGSDDGGGAKAAAEDVMSALLDRDFGAIYNALHPEFQALTTRAEYTDCSSAAESVSAVNLEVEAVDSYVEDGFTYVDVRITGEGLIGESAATVTLGMIEADGDWYLVDALGGDEDGPDCIPGDEDVRDALRS